jgi:hypothetical protein
LGVPARVVAVRPFAGQLEVEAVIFPSRLASGAGARREAPPIVRAGAPLAAALAPGADIYLAAQPEDAFVFPCRDADCRA